MVFWSKAPLRRPNHRARVRRSRLRMLDVARVVSWHRRKLAVVAAVAAVLTAITAAAPPDPPTVTVVRAVRPLAPGSRIGPDQVRLEQLPESAVPRSYIDQVALVVGRTVVAEVPVGQVLTEHSTLSAEPALPGRVVAPVRLADPDVVTLLNAGDRVDVLSADGHGSSAQLLVQRARIVAIPDLRNSGSEIRAAPDSAGGLILLDVDPQAAAELAQAAVAARLSVVLRS
jgi:pilus assembly protein CpaB